MNPIHRHIRNTYIYLDYCSLPKQTGDCSEKQPRWYYSETDKKCMPFYYTGCGGNKNKFPSLQSCEDHCPKYVGKIFKIEIVALQLHLMNSGNEIIYRFLFKI